MRDQILNVSWLAMLAGAALAHVIGWLWYSPGLFGRRWAAGLGKEYDQSMPVALMIQQAAGLLLISWFVAVCVAADLVAVAILDVLGFSLQNYAGEGFAGHSQDVRLINAGYWFASALAMLFVHMLAGTL